MEELEWPAQRPDLNPLADCMPDFPNAHRAERANPHMFQSLPRRAEVILTGKGHQT